MFFYDALSVNVYHTSIIHLLPRIFHIGADKTQPIDEEGTVYFFDVAVHVIFWELRGSPVWS